MLGFLEFVFGCLSVLVLYDVLYSGQVSLIRKSKNGIFCHLDKLETQHFEEERGESQTLPKRVSNCK